MKRMIRFCSVIAAMVLMSVQVLMAQTTVKITGQVTDMNGEPLLGIKYYL